MLSKPIITKPLRQKTPACLPFPLGRGSASYVRMHVEYLLAETSHTHSVGLSRRSKQAMQATGPSKKLTSGSPARPGGRGERFGVGVFPGPAPTLPVSVMGSVGRSWHVAVHRRDFK